MEMILVKKRCLLTNEEFIPKRQNQVYINRKAQIFVNNEKARQKRLKLNPTNKILEKNRNILSNILGSQKQIIKSRDYLLGSGFNFKFFSQSLLYEKKPCQVIYEYMIYSNGDQTFTIKKII